MCLSESGENLGYGTMIASLLKIVWFGVGFLDTRCRLGMYFVRLPSFLRPRLRRSVCFFPHMLRCVLGFIAVMLRIPLCLVGHARICMRCVGWLVSPRPMLCCLAAVFCVLALPCFFLFFFPLSLSGRPFCPSPSSLLFSSYSLSLCLSQ